MAYYRIPLPNPSEPSIRLSTALDGVTFFIDLSWNTRDSAWYFSLYDYEEEPIIEGVRCVIAWPLLARVVDVRRPGGELFFVEADGKTDEDPGEELGDRWRLMYVDSETYQTIKETAEALNA